jgi:predicted DNA-binding transcriptional regulator YafY
MRASRLVNLLLLLQSRGGMTAAELARELEVSVRTVHRDVEELSAAGVPIYAERGPTGGIRLVDGYRTRLTGMTADEAEALFLSGLPGPAAQLGLGTVVAAAQLKVMAALPSELRSRASRLVERFHLDAGGWFSTNDPVPHLPVIAQAVWEGRCVAIVYGHHGSPPERNIAPLGVVLKAGVWYVVASQPDGEPRTFRVSRIATCRPLDVPAARPDGFDLATYWAESSSAYERESPSVEVVIRIAPNRIDRLAVFVGRWAVDRAEHLDVDDPDGWEHLRLRLNWPEDVHGQLLAVGSSLEVLEPPGVRARVQATASRVVARYGDSPTPAVPDTADPAPAPTSATGAPAPEPEATPTA